MLTELPSHVGFVEVILIMSNLGLLASAAKFLNNKIKKINAACTRKEVEDMITKAIETNTRLVDTRLEGISQKIDMTYTLVLSLSEKSQH